jgi:SAM-dependent methyltransferase
MAASPTQVEYVESVMSLASGVVLELGPGGGDQTFHFKPNRIEKIYAAEPNRHLHLALVAKAKEIGMVDKYVPMTAGAQPESLLPALVEAGILPQNFSKLPEEGVFDSIVTIKSMCSAPSDRLSDTVAVLLALLKPGGQFLFFEHLHNDTSFFTQLYASTLNFLIWPALMGGCRLDGNLDKLIMGMSGWQMKEIENVPQYKGYEVFRYIKGICTKA